MALKPTLAPSARIVLFGYPSNPAHLEVIAYPGWARLVRTAGAVAVWFASTALAVVLTFDPFIASFPFAIGAWTTYRNWRGRYRVQAFHAACPRCARALEVKPGSKIDLPHSLVCYGCHFEPELCI